MKIEQRVLFLIIVIINLKGLGRFPLRPDRIKSTLPRVNFFALPSVLCSRAGMSDSGSGDTGLLEGITIIDGPGAPAAVALAWTFYMGLLACCLCGGIFAFLKYGVEEEVSLWPFDKLWARASSGPTWASSNSGTTSTGEMDSTRSEVNAAI